MSGASVFPKLSFDEVKSTLNMNASPGYPHVLAYANKKSLFEDDAAVELLRADFETDRFDGFYNDFPKKDELLKPGKRIRQICGVSVDIGMKFAAVSTAFNHHIEQNAALPIELGISIYGGGWYRVADKQRQGQLEMALDASNFDASVSCALLNHVCELRCRFASPRDQVLLRKAYKHLMFKRIVDIDGIVYNTSGGMASGHVSTAHDNSLISWTLFTWFIYDTFGFHCLDDYLLSFYGDDVHVVYKSGATRPPFSTEQIVDWYYDHCFVLKSEGWKNPFEADFLSMKTTPTLHRNVTVYVPVPVRHEKLLSSMYYVDRDDMTDLVLQLERLVQLRDMLCCTPLWVEANKLLDQFVARCPLSVRSTAFARVLQRVRTRGQIIDFITGLDRNLASPNKISIMAKNKQQNKSIKRLATELTSVAKVEKKIAKQQASKPRARAKPANRKAGPADPFAMNAKQMRAGAVNILDATQHPSKCGPIRFPNLDDISIGTEPFKETMKASLNVNSPASGPYSSNYIAGGFLNFGYSDPFYTIASVATDTVGTIVFSSVGHPSGYSPLTNIAAMMRINAVSIRFLNFSRKLYEGGRLFVLQWAGEWPDNTLYSPASVQAILTNPMTRVINMDDSMVKNEFTVPCQKISLRDFHNVGASLVDAMASTLVFVFISDNTAGVPSAMNIEFNITLHGEYVPFTAYQLYSDTRTTKVTQDAVAEVQDVVSNQFGNVNSSSGLPGVFSDAWSTAKKALAVGREIYDVGKSVWDFASPYITDIAMGFGLMGEERHTCIGEFLEFSHVLCALHRAHPSVVHIRAYRSAKNAYFGGVWYYSRGFVPDPEPDELTKAIVRFCTNEVDPHTSVGLLKYHIKPEYYVDPHNLPHDWAVDFKTHTLCYKNCVVAGVSNGSVRCVIMSVNSHAFIRDHVLYVLMGPESSSCPLHSESRDSRYAEILQASHKVSSAEKSVDLVRQFRDLDLSFPESKE